MFKTYCPKCEKEYKHNKKREIVKCRTCGSDVVSAVLSYENIWISPNKIIHRFNDIISKYGAQEAVRNIKFQREREAWISAVWALGLGEIYDKDYWVEIEEKDTTPDNYVYFLEEVDGSYHRQIFNVEIVEWEEHTNSALELIKKKCAKNYPDYFTLLVYGRKPGEEINLETLYQEVSKLEVPFGQIWIVAAVVGVGEDVVYQITSLYPNKNSHRFNLQQAMKNKSKQVEFCSFLQRGTGTEARDLGTLYLPLPEL